MARRRPTEPTVNPLAAPPEQPTGWTQATEAKVYLVMDKCDYSRKLHDDSEINDAEKKAKAYYQSKVVPYATMAGGVMTLALGTAKKFQANKLIPKSSTATVGAKQTTASIQRAATSAIPH